MGFLYSSTCNSSAGPRAADTETYYIAAVDDENVTNSKVSKVLEIVEASMGCHSYSKFCE